MELAGRLRILCECLSGGSSRLRSTQLELRLDAMDALVAGNSLAWSLVIGLAILSDFEGTTLTLIGHLMNCEYQRLSLYESGMAQRR
jgi:hypothetical protein